MPGETLPLVFTEEQFDSDPTIESQPEADESQSGLLVFDNQMRVLTLTEQFSKLLALPSGNNLEESHLLHMLSLSKLDETSRQVAESSITAFIDGELYKTHSTLRVEDRRIRFRLRGIGRDYGILTCEAAIEKARARLETKDSPQNDSLTGLMARRFFEEAVQEELRAAPNEAFAILLLDLDRFKAVNDTLGHAAGDALLKMAAQRLKACVRKTDVVARLGGDEFAILIRPISNAEEPCAIAHRILDLVQRTYFIEGQLINVGTSIGISMAPEQGRDCADLLRKADLALYHSKFSGRGIFHFFDAQMEQRAQARRTSELELRRALALRQLEVFYQPQVDTTRNCLVGFEALIRWRHPEKGLISPANFLPIAEEIGVIVPIGEWVLRTACREAMNWPEHITVAVNASPLQFDKGNFAESVKKALIVSGLPGKRLEIEITEGILLRNDDSVLNTLHALRSMDVRIAMDDFGTGYASLSQLAKFPFDKIKIDRSLAGFEGPDVKQRAIVRAITSLGRSLGVCTLAEGVENAAQIERLRTDGCTSVQGYFYSKPVPADQLHALISKFHPSSEPR